MKRLLYWTCGGCGQTLQGIRDRDGDFISDKEIAERARPFRAVGCYLCGCPAGAFGEEVTEQIEDPAYQ